MHQNQRDHLFYSTNCFEKVKKKKHNRTGDSQVTSLEAIYQMTCSFIWSQGLLTHFHVEDWWSDPLSNS